MNIEQAMNEAQRKMPKWAIRPFRDFAAQSIEICDVLHMACSGIAMLRARPQALEALQMVAKHVAQVLPELGEQQESHSRGSDELQSAQRQAKLAQEEVEKGFPLLHGQAVISMWGSLEAFVTNLLAALIVNEPAARDSQPLRRVKISIAEYDELDSLERALYILDVLERDRDIPLKHGVTRFEALLDVFGLGGAVEETIRKHIYELGQVRNVLVHRRGFADKRLVNGCPWLALEVGQRLAVNHADFERYHGASTEYFFVVFNRFLARYDLPVLDLNLPGSDDTDP